MKKNKTIITMVIFLIIGLFSFFIYSQKINQKKDNNILYSCTYVDKAYTKNVQLNFFNNKLKSLTFTKGFNLKLLKNKEQLEKQHKLVANKLKSISNVKTKLETDKNENLNLIVDYTIDDNYKEETINDIYSIMLLKIKDISKDTIIEGLKNQQYTCKRI